MTPATAGVPYHRSKSQRLMAAHVPLLQGFINL
jgi:hypothetical protein